MVFGYLSGLAQDYKIEALEEERTRYTKELVNDTSLVNIALR